MKTLPLPSLRRATLAALLAVAAAAAGAADPKATQFYEDALLRFEKKDYAGAVVQLKNVLKADARNLSAQLLLGKALLENNELSAAEVAFNEALRLGVNRGEVAVPLARAVINQGKPDEVLNDTRFALEGLPAPARYQMLLLRANAATDLADVRTALKAAEDARAIDAADPGSWIAEVPVRIRARQNKEALAAADKAVALAPAQADAHFVRGEALHVVPDLKTALVSYDKALSLDPSHVGALVARAGVHMDLNGVEAAARDIVAVGKAAPRDPRGVYLKALLAERQGRAADARSALNELTGMLDPIPLQFLRYRPQTQMLGGMAHYSLGQYEKAKPYLEGVLRSQPGHPVSKVVANIHLADRNVDRAVELLDGYTRANPGDAQAMLLLASAHMSQGRYARATQIMQEALKTTDQPQLRTALGLSLVGGARYGAAIKELDAVFSKDPRSLQAGYALASLYVQSGQAGAGVRVAETLAKHYPDNPGLLNLLGTARQSKGDSTGARTAFEAAAAADPAFVPAQLSLARLEMDAKALPKAAARLNALLVKNDKHLDLLGALSVLAERSGQLVDAQRWLLKADEHAGIDNPAPALALVDLNLRHGQTEPAREALKRAQNKAPDGVPTLIAAARVALAGGDSVGARSSLTRASTHASHNPPQLTQIALLQSQSGAPQAAAYTLDKALGERADYLPALALRAEMDLRLGEPAKAEQKARQILALQPKLGLGHALLGDLASARGQREVAIAAYRQAHELDKSSESFMRLFAATARRDSAAAQRLAEPWLSANPADTTVWRALADTQFVAGNLPGARRSYESLIKLRPADAEGLNNLANVMLAQRDVGALRTAELALAQAPGTPHIIGTTGWAAFKAGQPDRALQLLREARVRDPANADTRYFLGSVLASQGSKTEARGELAAALKAGLATSYRGDAEKLLSTLD